jgi:hypothetical protein
MAAIQKTCECIGCSNQFETANPRKRFCSDKCRLEQWEADNGTELRRVKRRPKRKAPSKPRTNWKRKYEEAEAEIARLRAQLAD